MSQARIKDIFEKKITNGGKYYFLCMGCDELLNIGFKMLSNAKDPFNLQKGEVTVTCTYNPIFYVQEGKLVFNENILNDTTLIVNTMDEKAVSNKERLTKIFDAIKKEVLKNEKASQEIIALADEQQQLIKNDVKSYYNSFAEQLIEIQREQDCSNVFLLKGTSVDSNMKYEKGVLHWFSASGVTDIETMDKLKERILKLSEEVFPESTSILIKTKGLVKLMR